MFTIKFYGEDNWRQRIYSAESFTILRAMNGGFEITLHQKDQRDDKRVDLGPGGNIDAPLTYQRAIIENAAGRTTEILNYEPGLAVKQSGCTPTKMKAA